MKRVRRIARGLAEAQERAERTLLGQGVISVVVLVILLTAVIWCLPDSVLKRRLQPVVTPVAMAAGLDQYWGVFAPNPPRQVDTVDVEVTLAGGRQVVWNIPRGDPVVGQYSWYHWQKIKENLVRFPGIRADFCRWVARQVAGPHGQATHVRMVLHSATLPPPGTAVPSKTSTSVLYDEQLTSAR